MTAPDLLARCRAAGLLVTAEGGRLRLAGGQAARAELVPLLAAHRSEVLAYLSAPVTHGCTVCGWHAFPTPMVCYWCRRRGDGRPLGAPCDGCGEACERCRGAGL